MTVDRLDFRAWLAWGAAAMTPLLVSRNPWILAQVLVIVSIVRVTWGPAMYHQGLGWFVRIAASFVLVGVAFNVVTVHAGNLVLARLPETWPVIGGALTWNALAYGVLGGLALFGLVLTGVTISALISWTDLFHVMPARLAPIAVTGSVAWAFLPQTAIAWRNIREAQVMRGHRFRAARDFIPIVVPLLAGGLDRSLAVAEALESRGFGASTDAGTTRRSRREDLAFGTGVVTGLGGLAVAVYCLAVGRAGWAAVAAILGGLSLAALLRLSPAPANKRTRYRSPTWTGADTLVTAVSLATLIAVLVWNGARPGSLAYTPYPALSSPAVDAPLLAVLGLLLAPATVYRPQKGMA